MWSCVIKINLSTEIWLPDDVLIHFAILPMIDSIACEVAPSGQNPLLLITHLNPPRQIVALYLLAWGEAGCHKDNTHIRTQQTCIVAAEQQFPTSNNKHINPKSK